MMGLVHVVKWAHHNYDDGHVKANLTIVDLLEIQEDRKDLQGEVDLDRTAGAEMHSLKPQKPILGLLTFYIPETCFSALVRRHQPELEEGETAPRLETTQSVLLKKRASTAIEIHLSSTNYQRRQ